MTLAEHTANFIRQIKCNGDTIGRRGTPAISYWQMRPKWEKWGAAWETLGTDGDIIHENNKPIIPAVLQLVYFRLGNEVCQLAYVLHPEESDPRKLKEAQKHYDAARCFMPRSIDAD